MKNKLSFIPAIIIAILITASCEKEKKTTVISKTVNVSIDENKSYSYTIPHSGDGDDAMQIDMQAQHYAVSKVTSVDDNTLFEYTPALNYSGNDEVHVTTFEGEHNGGNNNHQKGNCQGQGHDKETETNYIFKITVVKTIFP